MQCSLSAVDRCDMLICRKCFHEDEPRAFRLCCPNCKTSEPPHDPATYRDPGEPSKPKRPMKSDLERKR